MSNNDGKLTVLQRTKKAAHLEDPEDQEEQDHERDPHLRDTPGLAALLSVIVYWTRRN